MSNWGALGIWEKIDDHPKLQSRIRIDTDEIEYPFELCDDNGPPLDPDKEEEMMKDRMIEVRAFAHQRELRRKKKKEMEDKKVEPHENGWIWEDEWEPMEAASGESTASNYSKMEDDEGSDAVSDYMSPDYPNRHFLV